MFIRILYSLALILVLLGMRSTYKYDKDMPQSLKTLLVILSILACCSGAVLLL